MKSLQTCQKSTVLTKRGNRPDFRRFSSMSFSFSSNPTLTTGWWQHNIHSVVQAVAPHLASSCRAVPAVPAVPPWRCSGHRRTCRPWRTARRPRLRTRSPCGWWPYPAAPPSAPQLAQSAQHSTASSSHWPRPQWPPPHPQRRRQHIHCGRNEDPGALPMCFDMHQSMAGPRLIPGICNHYPSHPAGKFASETQLQHVCLAERIRIVQASIRDAQGSGNLCVPQSLVPLGHQSLPWQIGFLPNTLLQHCALQPSMLASLSTGSCWNQRTPPNSRCNPWNPDHPVQILLLDRPQLCCGSEVLVDQAWFPRLLLQDQTALPFSTAHGVHAPDQNDHRSPAPCRAAAAGSPARRGPKAPGRSGRSLCSDARPRSQPNGRFWALSQEGSEHPKRCTWHMAHGNLTVSANFLTCQSFDSTKILVPLTN